MQKTDLNTETKTRKVGKIVAVIIASIAGIIIIIGLALVAYIAIAHPFDIQPKNSSEENPAADTYNNPYLNDEQQKTLESFGVDTSTIPTAFTKEQINCFNEKLGPERVKEIEGGSAPTPSDYFKAKDCMK